MAANNQYGGDDVMTSKTKNAIVKPRQWAFITLEKKCGFPPLTSL
jgi:hypothetical protein